MHFFAKNALVRKAIRYGLSKMVRGVSRIARISLSLGVRPRVVVRKGWITIAYTLLISNGVFWKKNWSEELAERFGYDVRVERLDHMCDWIIGDIKGEFDTKEDNF